MPRNGLPQSRTVRLVYCSQDSINGGAAGIAAVKVFSANGIYDPDITGSGHQPMGFDQIMPLYDHYTVIASRIRVRFAPYASGDLAIPPMVGIHISDSASAITGLQPEHIAEIGSKTQQYGMANQVGFNRDTQMRAKVNVKKYFKVKSLIGDSLYRGDASSNPSEQVYFILWAAGLGGNDATQVGVFVEIEYLVKFTEPKALGQS